MIGASMLSPVKLLIQREAFRRLHDPDFRSEFVSNELGGSPVWGEALAADEPFHPSRQTVLTPSRPKHVPSERADAPGHRP